MSTKFPEQVTFQVTVTRLNLWSRLPKKDIRVTVCVGDVSKITCSGKLPLHRLSAAWNHPFLFTASPSTIVRIAICTLPEELTLAWDKRPLGEPIVTDVATLLKSGGEWQRKVAGLSIGLATLSMICRTCDILRQPAGHDCVSTLKAYNVRLYEFGQRFKNVACVSTHIEVGLARLDLCPKDHADHSSILNDLAFSFDSRYIQEGKPTDINRAIYFGQMRLDLCPVGHPRRANALAQLAISFWKFYCIQKNEADLNRLIDMQQSWLDLCPKGHPDHGRPLSALALSLQERYNLHGDILDLNRAVEMGQERLDLCPIGHPNYSVALGNLAVFLKARYEKKGDIADLDRAIYLQEECLRYRPPGHPIRGLALQRLGLSFKDRYEKEKAHFDLIKALELFKVSLEIFPVQDRQFACTVDGLAAIIIFSLKSSQGHQPLGQPLPSLDEAFGTYRRLMACGPAISLDLWNATQAWVKNAEEYNHSSVLEAYQTSLNTLDHFTSFNSSLHSRHEIMQARVTDLASNAFSCGTRRGDIRMAVELLEQGRGILWNQLSRFDISIAALESRGNEGHELARKYKQLSTDLRKHAEGSAGKDMDPYWRVQDEWQSVVNRIRDLDGFSRFLLPPRFVDLQQAAEYGPVIIVNASEYGCDAIIILRARPPVHVLLPECSLDTVTQLCLDLSALTQDPNAYGGHRELYVKQVLRGLWTAVVEPIVTVLQNDVQLPVGSRIWWCPTSKFTILPLHAAGPHKNGEKNLMDIYIPSYAPSLSALIRTHDRMRSQKEPRGANVSFAAVGQARPNADLKLCELPNVELEIQKIRHETSIPSHVKFETVTGDAALVEGAVRAFRNHRWVHLACHGAHHAKNPFESWFAMGDGKLTLMRIIQERYAHSEFAFLSACYTAVGNRSTPDEVLHLAAGMQFAGFNGVIGTLWRVDDTVAHQVVTRFYKEMFRHPDIDFKHAAAALKVAVMETAKQVSLEKRIVFVHIGI